MRICYLILVALFYLTACTVAENPATQVASTQPAIALSATPTMEQATPVEPSATPTATPIPAVPHSWNAQINVAMLYHGAGMIGYDVSWTRLPEVVVYADGTVIYLEGRGIEERQIWEGRVSPAEICNLLYQIEATRFFSIRQSDYKEPHITDVGTTTLEVHGWESNAINAYALGVSTNDESLPPTTQTLLSVAGLLARFRPLDAVPYQPERVEVRLMTSYYRDQSAELWPLTAPTLAQLAARADADGIVLLEGEEARAVHTLFANRYAAHFSDGGETILVAERPQLPHEGARRSGWSPPPRFVTETTTPISCSPEMEAAALPPTATPEPTPAIAVRAPLIHIGDIGARDGDGQMANASSVIVLETGDYLISDSGNRRLSRYAADGTLLAHTPLPTPGNWPNEIALLPDGTLAVAAYGVITVRALDGTILEEIRGWPEPPEEQPHRNFNLFALGDAETFYGAEQSGSRVVALNRAGEITEVWEDENSLSNIRDLATDSAGNLYIALSGPPRVLRRTTTGETKLFEMGLRVGEIAPLDDMTFYTFGSGMFQHYSADGTLIHEWSHPDIPSTLRSLTTAPDGSLVALVSAGSEQRDGILYHFEPTGELRHSFGSTKLRPGQFGTHSAFAVARSGDVWLVDTGDPYNNDHNVQLVHVGVDRSHLATFDAVNEESLTCNDYVLAATLQQSLLFADPCTGTVTHVAADGTTIARWGERGMAVGQFNLIADSALSTDETTVFLLDSGSRRITQHTLDGQLLASWELESIQPIDFALVENDLFYVLDAKQREVVILQDGERVGGWTFDLAGRSGQSAATIAVDTVNGYVYIGSDDINLYMYRLDGTPLGAFGFSDSRGVTVEVGADGTVYRSAGYEKIQTMQPNQASP